MYHKIEGIGASRGKAEAKAAVLDVDRIDKLVSKDLKNKIIVVKYTKPEMVPLMLNLKGIIAEDGAILSHAAIISREFKIPCVIGVKNATKLIKNNDFVSIDGETGEVRIKKSKRK